MKTKYWIKKQQRNVFNLLKLIRNIFIEIFCDGFVYKVKTNFCYIL
ncbi:hypothetical protein AC26_3495 [Escherichia coli 1-176-05_S3_C2]|nr:hypothetical protein AC26_3495 [Escherichia coli 1-176-05_S3_C2]